MFSSSRWPPLKLSLTASSHPPSPKNFPAFSSCSAYFSQRVIYSSQSFWEGSLGKGHKSSWYSQKSLVCHCNLHKTLTSAYCQFWGTFCNNFYLVCQTILFNDFLCNQGNWFKGLQSERKITLMCDVWSLGIVITKIRGYLKLGLSGTRLL